MGFSNGAGRLGALSYRGLDILLCLSKNYKRRLAHATTARRGGPDCIVIELVETDILAFYKDGRIELNNGGWWTPYTRIRMNQLLPDRVSVVGGSGGRDWKVLLQIKEKGRDDWGCMTYETKSLEYFNHMILPACWATKGRG